MWQPLFRIILLVILGYGLFRAAPLVIPPVGEVVKNSGINQGDILGEATNYVNNLLGNDVGDNNDEKTENVVDKLVSKTKDSVAEKVQVETDKAKEGTKNVINEQFCRTILKTLEQECGRFYCSE